MEVRDLDIKSKTTMVNFLTGKFRAAVEKDINGKVQDKKFLVKTRNAVLGVRGTQFQVTYNKAGDRTSLLTYKGRVDIKKMAKEDEVKLRASGAGTGTALAVGRGGQLDPPASIPHFATPFAGNGHKEGFAFAEGALRAR